MELKLIRNKFTEKSTIGELFVDGVFECYVLEDVVREEKVYGETAIPYGTYRVISTYSPRFKRYLPLLLDVPNFKGIRIHSGNTAKDTEGCLLPGTTKSKDFVGNSRKAFDTLNKKIIHALQNDGPVFIEIKKG